MLQIAFVDVPRVPRQLYGLKSSTKDVSVDVLAFVGFSFRCRNIQTKLFKLPWGSSSVAYDLHRDVCWQHVVHTSVIESRVGVQRL